LLRSLTKLGAVVVFASALAWIQIAGRFREDASSPTCVYSSLWGVAGEKWKAEDRLADFSYAGYHGGEVKIPTPPAKWDLKRDFHAVGDGRTDDSQALLDAIQSINRGVLFIP